MAHQSDNLSLRERGFAVAAVRALASDATTLCAARSEALGHYAARLHADPMWLLAEGRALDQPPAGLERVHPSWWTAPPTSARPEALRWLQHQATASLVPMGPT